MNSGEKTSQVRDQQVQELEREARKLEGQLFREYSRHLKEEEESRK